MAEKVYVIAPFESGLMTNMPAWELPDDGLTVLRNAVVYRNRIKKRIGARLLGTPGENPELQQMKSRLRMQIGSTNNDGDRTVTLTPTLYGTPFQRGLAFSIGDVMYTVQDLGTPATLLVSSGTSTGTFNTTTGDLVITGADPLTPVYYYPLKPVMGLTQSYAELETGRPAPINNQPTVAFDTRRAYYYTANGWEAMGDPANPVNFWSGGETDFFWAANFEGGQGPRLPNILFATNFNANPFGTPLGDDNFIKYWNSDTQEWVNYAPYVAPNNVPPTPGNSQRIMSARIIVQWYRRLLLFNTIENVDTGSGYENRQFGSRVRYSAITNPLNDNAFYEFGTSDGTLSAIGAGAKDAATQEQIISIGFIKNNLIVYFEQSTWVLTYSGNQSNPFEWQRLTAELGAVSTFSTVSFDDQLLAIGNTGVHACSGVGVQRIDEKIPDFVFQIKDSTSGIRRVQGIRDFYNELVYWSMPKLSRDATESDYPTRILVYNYRNSSWATYDDCITAFGYFEQSIDLTWAQCNFPWYSANFNWTAGLQQANFRSIVAGNQQGFTFELYTNINRNAPALSLIDVTILNPGQAQLVIPRHNLARGEVIAVEFATGVTNLNRHFQIQSVVNEDTVAVITVPSVAPFTGTYEGNGLVTKISQVDVQTKAWNPYIKENKNVAVNKVQCTLVKTSTGMITMDYYVNNSTQPMGINSVASGSAWGTQLVELFPYDLYPLEKSQTLINRMYYPQAHGSNFMLRFYYDMNQMLTPLTAWSYFELQSIQLYTKSAGSPLD